MATYDTTSKYALRALQGTSQVQEIDDGIKALRDDVAANMAGFSQGLKAAILPTSGATITAASAAGRVYQCTDTGEAFVSTGTTWIPITGPIARHTDAPGTEQTLTTTFATLMSVTFTPPFNNLEYQVMITCGVFLATAASAGSASLATFEFRLDGTPVGYVDGSSGQLQIQTQAAQSAIADLQGAWHFPLYIPAGTHTFTVVGKKAGTGAVALVRAYRRLTLTALGNGIG